jgi:hypothetical protein
MGVQQQKEPGIADAQAGKCPQCGRGSFASGLKCRSLARIVPFLFNMSCILNCLSYILTHRNTLPRGVNVSGQ